MTRPIQKVLPFAAASDKGELTASLASRRKSSLSMPKIGTSTKMLEPHETADQNVNSDGVQFPAWRRLTGREFQTRSAGYLKHKTKKLPPSEALYDCVSVDILESSERTTDIAQKVNLTSKSEDSQPRPWHCPDHFIVSVAIPSDVGGGKKGDENGYTIIVYSKMTSRTLQILEHLYATDPSKGDLKDDLLPQVNAVKLFDEWCRRSPDDATFQGRFKLVPDALNLAELGLPSWIVRYKNKPVLIKRTGVTGTVYKHADPSTLEFHINFHAFHYLVRKAFVYLKDVYFKQLICNAGFVIEGRNDEELPEIVISCFQLCNPDPETSVQAKDFFNGTSPKSNQ